MPDNDDAQILWACVKEEAELRESLYPKVSCSDAAMLNPTVISLVNRKLKSSLSPLNFTANEALWPPPEKLAQNE